MLFSLISMVGPSHPRFPWWGAPAGSTRLLSSLPTFALLGSLGSILIFAFVSVQAFPTLVTPVHCSEVLRAWIGSLTANDREMLRLWGISSRTLNVAEVEVSCHLLCTAARFWKPSFHVFRFGLVEMTPTLEEVRRICGLLPLSGPAVFMRREGSASSDGPHSLGVCRRADPY